MAEEAKFAELALTESDCSSAKKGGDLGSFGRGRMQSEWTESEIALQHAAIYYFVIFLLLQKHSKKQRKL